MTMCGLLLLLLVTTFTEGGPLQMISTRMTTDTIATCKILPICYKPDHVIDVDSKHVEVGTACMNMRTRRYFKCDESGIWIAVRGGPPRGPRRIKRWGLRRSIRSIGRIISKPFRFICKYICHGGGARGAIYVPNTPPVLDCPYVPLQKPTSGRSTVVTWTEPVGSDKEDGNLKPKRTGPSPGSVFQLGYNQVSYRITDKGGLSDKCTIAIQVAAFKCPRLQYPRHGRLHCTDGDISGSTCTVTCDEGYTIDGSKSTTCQKESWSQQLPVCKASSCGSYPVIDNVFVTCLGPPQYNTYCILSCKTGYELEGIRMTVCQASGQWTATGSCIDKTPPSFTNGCPDDIEHTASMRNTQTTVTWTYTGVKDNSGSEVHVTASPPSGSEFTMGTSKVVVTATDKEGNEATCRFTVTINSLTCPEPVLKDEKLRYTCPDGYGYGFNCSIYCHSNYPMIGSDIIVCLKETSVFPPKAAWSWPLDSQEPKCVVSDCPKLREPKNGAIVQDGWNNGAMAVMMCNTKYDVPRKVPELFACGTRTSTWRPSDTVYDCSRARRAGQMNLPSELYYYSGTCGNKTTEEEIRNMFITILNSSTAFTDLCGVSVPGCRAENVVIMCGDTSRRRRSVNVIHKISKRAAGVLFTFEIVTPFEQKDREDVATARTRVEAELTSISSAIDTMVKNEELNMADYGLVTRADSFRPGYTDFKCDGPGTKPNYKTGTCRGCPDGTYVEGEECPDCPVGTHTDPDSPNTCTQCDAGKSTLSMRSTSAEECIAVCPLGTYSMTGLVPCMPCSPGSYQDQTGSKSCKMCSTTTTTREEGTPSRSGCMDFDLKFENNGQRTFGNVNTNMSSLTLAFWMKISSLGYGIVSMYSKQGNISLNMFASKNLTLDIFGQTVTTAISLPSEKWQHLAVTVDKAAKEITLYVGGKAVFTGGIASLDNHVLVEGNILTGGANGALHLRSVILVNTVLPLEKIRALASSCGSVEENLKYSFIRFAQKLVIPSHCDNTDECASDPCGTHPCIDKGDNFQCDCENGWTGATCTTPPDYCKKHECQHSATCKNANGNYTCTCTKGFRGDICQETIVNGNWGKWSWSDCSKTCGGGTRRRIRECNDPPPDEDGDDCVGDKVNTQSCNQQQCPVCPTLTLSFGNIKNCTDDGDGFVKCTVECRDDLVFRQPPLEVYECGPLSGYTWNHQEFDQMARPPSCTNLDNIEVNFICRHPPSLICKPPSCENKIHGARGSTGYNIRQSVSYPSLPCGTASTNKEAITSQIKGKLLDLDCSKEDICRIKSDVSDCDSARGKRSTQGTTVIIYVTSTMPSSAILDLKTFVDNDIVTAGLKEYLNIVMKTDASIEKLVNNSATLLTVTIDGTQYQVDLATMKTTTAVLCPDGTYPSEGVCGECPPGTQEEANICVFCKKGTYQPQAASTTCRTCPQGKTTLGEGSDDVSHCIPGSNNNKDGNGEKTATPVTNGELGISTIVGVSLGTAALVGIGIGLAVLLLKIKKTPWPKPFSKISPSRPNSPPPPYVK